MCDARECRLAKAVSSLSLQSNLRQRAIRHAVVRLSCPATGCWSERQAVGQAPASWLFLCSVVCWGGVLAGCCLQASRGREESEEVRGAGRSPVWWMPVSNDSEGRWLQFHEGAGRSEAEWEQVKEGLRTKERGGQEMIKKKRRSTDGRAGSTESHSDGHCLSHPLPQAEATINVLSPRPRGTIRVLSIVPRLWLATAARSGGLAPGRANGTRRRRAASDSTLNIHRGRRRRVGGQGVPSSTSALPPRRHGPIKRQPPNRLICGVVSGDTHCRFLFSASSASRTRGRRRSRGRKSKLL